MIDKLASDYIMLDFMKQISHVGFVSIHSHAKIPHTPEVWSAQKLYSLSRRGLLDSYFDIFWKISQYKISSRGLEWINTHTIAHVIFDGNSGGDWWMIYNLDGTCYDQDKTLSRLRHLSIDGKFRMGLFPNPQYHPVKTSPWGNKSSVFDDDEFYHDTIRWFIGKNKGRLPPI